VNALDDWVTDFDATLTRVLGFVDLPPDPACARFCETDALSPLIEELERGGAPEDWRKADGAQPTATQDCDGAPPDSVVESSPR
jgi:hypothetical protein